MSALLRRLRYFLRRSRHDADLRDEIESHRAHRQDALAREGLEPDAAAWASRRAIGNVTLAVEDVRDVWAARALDNMQQDVRAAVRGLRKSPGFAVVAIGTLALGIGANTALFSIFSSLILRPLPVRDPGSLALLTNGSWSYPIWQEIRARDDLFDGAFAWAGQSFDLSPSGQSDLVDGAYVSGRLFDVLGVTAIRGRMITPADDGSAPSFGTAQDAPSASRGADGPVAVISHRLWRQRFAGASDVVGRQLTVQRVPFTIVGVMPPGFFGPDVGRMTDVMLPFAAEPLIRGQESRLARGSSYVAADHGAPEARSKVSSRRTPRSALRSRRSSRRHHSHVSATSRSRWHRPPPAIRRCARASRRRSSRWSWPSGSCCSSRAPTSPACCSRGRWRGAASSACAWRWGAHAGGSRGCSSSRA